MIPLLGHVLPHVPDSRTVVNGPIKKDHKIKNALTMHLAG